MRNLTFTRDEYYHLVDRGTRKQPLFLEDSDYARFLFLLLHFQSPTVRFHHIGSRIKGFFSSGRFFLKTTEKNALTTTREVSVIAFTLMPNHFHILVKNMNDTGISHYMHRVVMAYSKYFNAKYRSSGHTFQGPFRAVHITTNEQLLHVSAYIHRNARELRLWKEKEIQYPWSSYGDLVFTNRWEGLLVPGIVLDQCNDKKDYQRFVETSPAKAVRHSVSDTNSS